MKMDETSPILLFDSGLGGLTVLSALREKLPQAPVIYAADTAGLPYGDKTEAEIAARVAGLLGRMSERFAPRIICIACNTASTIALGMVRSVLQVPIVGTVPAIKPAAFLTRTGTIGLLGTAATIRQRYVDDLEAEFAADKRLIRHAAPELVSAAEAKMRGHTPDPGVFARAIEGMQAKAGDHVIDTVVLACTHFPLIEEELSKAAGGKIIFVDGAQGIARRIAQLTSGQDFVRSQPDRATITGPIDDALASALLPYGLTQIEPF